MTPSANGKGGSKATKSKRPKMPDALRTEVLMANRHLCCVCQKGHLQLHHINADNTDNRAENVAVLCLEHHAMATAPPGLTARLREAEVRRYKHEHEAACAVRAHKLARQHTAFFMVDYKNVERIYQLFLQLSQRQREDAVKILDVEFKEEDILRKEQGFDISPEPTIEMDEETRGIFQLLKAGVAHPDYFKEVRHHPLDTNLPVDMPHKGTHDKWVQVMVRMLLVTTPALAIEDLMKLANPAKSGIVGRLITVNGRTRGKYFRYDDYMNTPVARTQLTIETEDARWRGVLYLKTHYVYSDTAAQSLVDGQTQGVVMIRDILEQRRRGGKTVVNFECTPLILGSGGDGPLHIP